MKEKYFLEIYHPGSVNKVWMSFGSDTPFHTIHKGDIINPVSFPNASGESMLRVTSVEHVLWGEGKHKLSVYTEDIEKDYFARFGFHR